MKEVDVYFEDKFIKTISFDEIKPDNDLKNWLIYVNEKLVGSIPINYLIIKK